MSRYDIPACDGLNDDTMFPDALVAADTYAQDVAVAKSYCDACPVLIKRECLAGAIERNERHGVWGGLDTEERDNLFVTLKELITV